MRPVHLLLAALAAPALADGTSSPAALEPVRFRDIRIGGFWKDQVKLQTEKWLPHCIRQMEAGGRGQELLNLVETAKVLRGEPHGAFTGLPWSDAYVYNTVEAVCLALAVDPEDDADLAAAQEFLRGKLEEWIPIILAAQMDDGYIHSFHTVNGHPRYSNIGWHEFYVMGYFIEMGIAHYRMTGGEDVRLLNAALRCADHLCNTFGPAPKRTWKNGHAGLEYALFRLARLMDEIGGPGRGAPYARLGRHFLDHQHEIQPNPYNQSEKPAVAMTEATGHAVRATYFYTAMTDVVLSRGDDTYRRAVDALWANAIHRKHYITGGVGAKDDGEAFGPDFDLRNDGYCESCAGCGMSFWADRMHRLYADGHYRDVQERVLYNNVLGALAADGENFFYQNPPRSSHARYPWHGCPCCVGNIPRALLAIKDLMYSLGPDGNVLYVSHFVDSDGTIPAVAGGSLRVRQQTAYPYEGDIALTLEPEKPVEFTLKLRIPDRTESNLYTADPDVTGTFTVRVNGEAQTARVEKGYASLQRRWQAGDRVDLSLPMPVQRVRCDDRVEAARGRVALQRGPLTYNVEDVDHPAPARTLVLPADLPLEAVRRPDLLGGITAIEGEGITAIPNYARLNRGGASRVWIAEDPEKAGLNTIASRAGVSVSFTREGMDPNAVNDPENARNFDFWPHKGGTEWIAYEFAEPATVSAVTVRWFDDTGRGQCRIPASWRLLYRDGAGTWKPVEKPSEYGTAKGAPVRTSFAAVTTGALRIEVSLQDGWSAGLWEWAVE